MPDLEQQIADWRSEMLAARLSPDDVAELESHLRDDIDQQLRSNRDAQSSFNAAIQRLGETAKLRTEFRKTKSLFRAAQKTLFTFAGIPNHYVHMNAPSPNLDSRWATYLRSTLFLLPAVCLWMLAAIFVIPQFHALWDTAAWDKTSIENAADFTNYLRFDLGRHGALTGQVSFYCRFHSARARLVGMALPHLAPLSPRGFRRRSISREPRHPVLFRYRVSRSHLRCHAVCHPRQITSVTSAATFPNSSRTPPRCLWSRR